MSWLSGALAVLALVAAGLLSLEDKPSGLLILIPLIIALGLLIWGITIIARGRIKFPK